MLRMLKKEMDLHDAKGNGFICDYLISSFGQVTATGLSQLLDGELSHDQITRMLSNQEYNSSDLWYEVKSLVREHENKYACLIFDDTIISKLYGRK
jgi:hypothetical protein